MKKELWDIWKESKYRIDFLFKKRNSFVWKETVDLLDNDYDAKEFIHDVFYNTCFPVTKEEIEKEFRGCDVIKVEVIEMATNEVISIYYWNKNTEKV